MIPQPILTHGPISWAGGRFANGSGYTTTDSRDHVLVWTTDLPDLPELPNLGEVFGTNANN